MSVYPSGVEPIQDVKNLLDLMRHSGNVARTAQQWFPLESKLLRIGPLRDWIHSLRLPCP